jgi:sterol desaturase/sphingolipid hydroxylase (fatty acid hydroxylase superfamily)
VDNLRAALETISLPVAIAALLAENVLIFLLALHARHHEGPTQNYGFYTLVWDRLFGTLAPEDRAPPKGSPSRARPQTDAAPLDRSPARRNDPA